LRIETSLERIARQLARVQELASFCELRAPAVSAWSVGEQLDHLLRASRSVLRRIASPPVDKPPDPSPTHLTGRLALWTGYMPRGVGKAPERILPQPHTSESLHESAAAVADLVSGLRGREKEIRASRDRFRHPFFGGFSAAQWVRFVEIHQHHHLKIAEDIRRAQPRRKLTIEGAS
jgi:hypothetical protein